MKRLILICLVILINARILQQIYFRTNKEQPVLLDVEQQNSEMVVNLPVLHSTPIAWRGVSSSYSDMNKSGMVEFNPLTISSRTMLSDRSFFTKNRLMGYAKTLLLSLVSSIDVWKGVFSVFREYLRSVIVSAFNQVYYSSISEVVIGLLLGKEGLVKGSSYHLFKVTGTQHLLAISGFHMSFFIMFVSKFYKNIFSKYAFICTNIIISSLFLYLVGFSPGLFRAFLMFFISSSALYFNRQKQTLVSFFLAFLISILFDISILLSVSFQLSYGATIGIILLSKLFKRINYASSLFLDGFPRVFGKISTYFVDSFLISIVAQISIFPLVAYHFHELNLFSVLTSSMISWMIPIIMQMGFVLVILYFVLPFNWFLLTSIPLFFFVNTMIYVLKTLTFDWSIVILSTFSINKIILSYFLITMIYSSIYVIKYIKKKQNYEKIYNFSF